MDYDTKHWTISSLSIDGSKTYKPKQSYDDELKAQEMCFKLNLKPNSIHKLVSYKCPICNKWHIGHHHNKLLNNIEKEKIRVQYNEWKLIHRL